MGSALLRHGAQNTTHPTWAVSDALARLVLLRQPSASASPAKKHCAPASSAYDNYTEQFSMDCTGGHTWATPPLADATERTPWAAPFSHEALSQNLPLVVTESIPRKNYGHWPGTLAQNRLAKG